MPEPEKDIPLRDLMRCSAQMRVVQGTEPAAVHLFGKEALAVVFCAACGGNFIILPQQIWLYRTCKGLAPFALERNIHCLQAKEVFNEHTDQTIV